MTVDKPAAFFEQTNIVLQQKIQLLKENTRLKQKQIYLQAQVQKLRALEAENQELRELLQSAGKENDSFSEARLIHVDSDPFRHQIMLNKGTQNGVEVGQPVIDSDGLVGVVLGVNEKTSRVLLLTDAGFAVPVQSVRSGERAIATGSGTGGQMRLNYVTSTADFVEGDQLVTSGLGGRFPAGYPVGVITSILHDPGTRFTLISISPSAKLGQVRHVLLVKHQNVATDEKALEVANNAELKQSSTVNEKTALAPVKANGQQVGARKEGQQGIPQPGATPSSPLNSTSKVSLDNAANPGHPALAPTAGQPIQPEGMQNPAKNGGNEVAQNSMTKTVAQPPTAELSNSLPTPRPENKPKLDHKPIAKNPHAEPKHTGWNQKKGVRNEALWNKNKELRQKMGRNPEAQN